MDWTPDHAIPYPESDMEKLKELHRDLLSMESPREKWVRQQWEVATSATKVALDAVRLLHPAQGDHFPEEEFERLARASAHLASVAADLDKCKETLMGIEYCVVDQGDELLDDN